MRSCTNLLLREGHAQRCKSDLHQVQRRELSMHSMLPTRASRRLRLHRLCHASYAPSEYTLLEQTDLQAVCCSTVALKDVQYMQIMNRVGEAYGRMMLETGLFQADGHPGNIIVMKNGAVGLVDFGQAKQLTDLQRRSIATTLLSLIEYATKYARRIHVNFLYSVHPIDA